MGWIEWTGLHQRGCYSLALSPWNDRPRSASVWSKETLKSCTNSWNSTSRKLPIVFNLPD